MAVLQRGVGKGFVVPPGSGGEEEPWKIHVNMHRLHKTGKDIIKD
jgi:hypothetical protein